MTQYNYTSGHVKIDGKKDKKGNSNFASFCTSSSQRIRVSRNVDYTVTIPCHITCVMLCYIT